MRLPPCVDHKVVRAHIIWICKQCFFQCLIVAAEGTKAHLLYSNVPPAYSTPLTGAAWALSAYYRVASNLLSGYFLLFAGSLHVQICNQTLALWGTFPNNEICARNLILSNFKISDFVVDRISGRIYNTIAWSRSCVAAMLRHMPSVSLPK